jgi:lipopolysaccharide/colanic/teichoic acid biosynthesis glycosyltransferase
MYPAAKRALDLLLATGGLVAMSPLFLVIAVMIKLDSTGPAFHRAIRSGRLGRPFTMYKFRSMRLANDQAGARITTRGDSRITRVGGWLRGNRLDELPQLINVIKGDMSLVGPRPEDPHYVAMYSEDQRAVLSVRPGITSLASLRYRDEAQLLDGPDWERRYVEHVMPAKLAIDLDYVRSANLLVDLRILAQTARTVVGG